MENKSKHTDFYQNLMTNAGIPTQEETMSLDFRTLTAIMNFRLTNIVH